MLRVIVHEPGKPAFTTRAAYGPMDASGIVEQLCAQGISHMDISVVDDVREPQRYAQLIEREK